MDITHTNTLTRSPYADIRYIHTTATVSLWLTSRVSTCFLDALRSPSVLPGWPLFNQRSCQAGSRKAHRVQDITSNDTHNPDTGGTSASIRAALRRLHNLPHKGQCIASKPKEGTWRAAATRLGHLGRPRPKQPRLTDRLTAAAEAADVEPQLRSWSARMAALL